MTVPTLANHGTLLTQDGNGTYVPQGLPSWGSAAGVSKGQYTTHKNLYLPASTGLQRTRAKIAKAIAGVDVCRVLCIGDSTTQGKGDGSNRSVTDYPARLAALIAQAGFMVSDGLVPVSQALPADARWGSFTGTWNDAAIYRQAAALNAAGTFTSLRAGTVVKVLYSNSQSTAQFSYKIDAAAAVNVTPPGGQSIGHVTIAGLANTSHTVTITSLTANDMDIVAVGVEPTAGFTVTNFGDSGAASSTWDSTWFENPPELGVAATPDLTVINLGINDYFTSVGSATFTTHLTNLVNQYTPTSDVILVVPNPTSAVASPSWSTYCQAVYAIAESLNVPVLDLSDRFTNEANMTAQGLVSVDGTHPTPSGYADIARGIYGVLFP